MVDGFGDILNSNDKNSDYNKSQMKSIFKKYQEQNFIIMDTADSYADFYPGLKKLYPKVKLIGAFKREKKIWYNYEFDCIPFPYLFNGNNFIKHPITKKNTFKHLIAFGWFTRATRAGQKKDLKKLFWKDFHEYHLPFQKHLELLNNIKYGLNLHWTGEYCFRFEEIAYSDTVMASQEYTIEVPNNFEDMKNIIFFKSIKELKEKLDNISDEKRYKIGKNFKEHYFKYHDTKAQLKYIDKHIQEIIKA